VLVVAVVFVVLVG